MVKVKPSGWLLFWSSSTVAIWSTVLLASTPGGYQAAVMMNAVVLLHLFGAILNISESANQDDHRPPSSRPQ